MEIILVGIALSLAFGNFKGFATVWGCRLLTTPARAGPGDAGHSGRQPALAGAVAGRAIHRSPPNARCRRCDAARRVAETMCRRITRLGNGQGPATNLITAGLVLCARKLDLPLSTTHVSVGSISGVGATAGTLDRTAVRNIALAWIVTLPVAATIAWLVANLS